MSMNPLALWQLRSDAVLYGTMAAHDLLRASDLAVADREYRLNWFMDLARADLDRYRKSPHAARVPADRGNGTWVDAWVNAYCTRIWEELVAERKRAGDYGLTDHTLRFRYNDHTFRLHKAELCWYEAYRVSADAPRRESPSILGLVLTLIAHTSPTEAAS